MKKILEPFSFTLGQYQDIITLIKHLDIKGASFEDFIAFIEEEKLIAVKERDAAIAKHELCPLCGQSMTTTRVNINSQSMTGDDSKKVYTCTNNDCMHQIFE